MRTAKAPIAVRPDITEGKIQVFAFDLDRLVIKALAKNSTCSRRSARRSAIDASFTRPSRQSCMSVSNSAPLFLDGGETGAEFRNHLLAPAIIDGAADCPGRQGSDPAIRKL